MQPFEYKVVKFTPIKRMIPFRIMKDDEIEGLINQLGGVGWQLVSTSDIKVSGTTKEIVLFFSRPAQRLEEMV